MAFKLETGLQVSLGIDKTTGEPTTNPDDMLWYSITDHNRSEIQANPTLIEKQSRMANGTMRKYVVASKYTISTSWNFIPVAKQITHTEKNKHNQDVVIVDSETADGAHGAGWLSAFYNANFSRPIWIKINNAKLQTVTDGIPEEDSHSASEFSEAYLDANPSTVKTNGSDTYNVFITNFSTTTVKRTPYTDYVNMDIEFTEI